MNNTFKTELKLFLAEALIQIIGWRREAFVFNLLNLDTRQRHILRERRRMTMALWYKVCRFYKWTCAQCGVQNWENKEWHKPKMEVDHAVSLWAYGKTEWANLQVLCKPHNRSKGIKSKDYRK